MCKTSLREDSMSDVAFVDQTAGWARELTRRESRGAGDLTNAWRRLEARYGVPETTFWTLRYRKPRDILVSVYSRLRSAYEAECARQIRILEHDLAITKTKVGPDHPAVAAATAVVDKARERKR